MADATSTQTTNSTLPGYVEPYVTDLFSRAQALTASSPAPTYMRPARTMSIDGGYGSTGLDSDRVAGLTSLQQQAGTSVSGLNAGNMLTAGNNSLASGANYTPSTGSFGLAAAQQYMNPYQQGVTDIAKREATRDDMIAKTGRDSAAAKAGAFGGSRHGVIEAEADRNLGQRLNDIQTQGLNTSWQQAQQQYNADATRQQQDRQFGSQAAIKGGEAMADLGKTTFGLQSTAGLLDQQTQQKGIDTGYQDWLNTQQHPYDQLTFMRNMVSGFPGSTTTQTTQSSPASNWASDFAGIGSAIGGLGSLFDLWAGGGHIPERKSGLGAGRVAQLYGSLA